MAGISLGVVVAAFPLLALISLHVDRSLAMASSIALGTVILILGMYLMFDLAVGQRRFARAKTRLAFYEEALTETASKRPSRRWFSPGHDADAATRRNRPATSPGRRSPEEDMPAHGHQNHYDSL